MARVYTQTARKERDCGKCGKKIEKGERYHSFSPGFRSRPQFRCTSCYPRPSDLTTSKMSGVYAAIETAQDEVDSEGFALDDAENVLNTAAEEIRNVAEEYQEASDAWAGGQGHDEFAEKADLLNGVADQLEDFQYSEEEYDSEDDIYDDKAEWQKAMIDELRQHIDGVELP